MPVSDPAVSIIASTGGVQRYDRWGATFLFSVAAIALGYALSQSAADLRAIVALAVAFVACLLGTLSGTAATVEKWGDRPTVLVLAVGLGYQIGYLLTSPVGVDLTNPKTAAPYAFALTAMTLLAGSNLSERRWLGALQIPLLLAAEFLLGAWLIKTSHLPVHAVQRDASLALLDGKNPYVATGYPYLPLTLFLDLPAQVLAQDHRYAQLAAMTLSGGFLAYARPGRVGGIVAALFLFTPRVFLVLQQGWTEPFLVLLLSASMYCACRRPKIFPYVLGLFFALKAYLILGLPSAVLLLNRPFKRREVLGLIWKALLTALLVTLPLALWDWKAFLKSVATLQLEPTSAGESLSFAQWAFGGASIPAPLGIAFVAALVFIAAALWRGSRTPGGFASGIALTYLAFFAFNPQASFNHYFFVLGALCCAVAATGLPGDMVGMDDFSPLTMVTKLGDSLVSSLRRGGTRK